LSGNHWYANKACFDCDAKDFSKGIFRKCYQGDYLSSLLRALYTKKSRRYILKSRVTFIAISKRIEEYIQTTFGTDVKILLIPNSVTERATIDSNADEVLYVSRLDEEKGLRHLLNIWQLSPTLPNLNIVGVGKLKPLADSAAKLDPRILVHGAKNGDDLELIARRCKVAVFPTLWNEPFGRTMIEAISRGQAIVATAAANSEKCVLVGMNGYICSISEMNLGTSVEKALALPFTTVSDISLGFYNDKYSDIKWQQNWLKAIKSAHVNDHRSD
jgi:glycosyltransferase involved in cell wall biosynthesis